ncbi:hypothetical protein WN51_13633 [Melipona quadrifasciata]|uniref:Uncharacterized protein n=1 Tax=Melipona quadrifasciata TaxID=166423 RepID=A0A0M9A0S0_9HYME|nr:hypothetical protein WN51_13633 [Melipona quadrifasciata]
MTATQILSGILGGESFVPVATEETPLKGRTRLNMRRHEVGKGREANVQSPSSSNFNHQQISDRALRQIGRNSLAANSTENSSSGGVLVGAGRLVNKFPAG